ncbi:hypothetical protein [Microbacterium esteraromaticum]
MMTSPAKTTLRLRTAAALTCAGITLAMLAGCSPQPEPTPTETPLFASEEEAFAAAEETYRSYTAALNDVDLNEPNTFETLYRYSTGDFQVADRETFSELHAESLTMVGEVAVVKFEGTNAEPPYSTIVAAVCVDVSGSDVLGEDGESRVAPSRPDINPLRVSFAVAHDEVLISRADRDESIQCAGE